jgi:pimeloyl-ACP methyl ester carboxylesterase
MKRLLAAIGCAAIPILMSLGIRRLFSEQKPFAVRADQSVAKVFGSHIRYRRTEGAGPPILLVHGYNLSIEDWEPVTGLLDGREVIAADLVGFGGSDRPADISYNLECQQRYLVGFMDAVGIERAVLVGHSIGGAIVGQVASLAPERVAGTVFIAPAGIPGCLSYRWPKSRLCRPGIVNRLAFDVSTSSWFRSVFPHYLVRQQLGLTGSFDDDYVARLGDIRSPALLIWSTGDERCRPEFADVYRNRVPDIEVRLIPPEIGHLVPVVEPYVTAALIGEFVDRLARSEK